VMGMCQRCSRSPTEDGLLGHIMIQPWHRRIRRQLRRVSRLTQARCGGSTCQASRHCDEAARRVACSEAIKIRLLQRDGPQQQDGNRKLYAELRIQPKINAVTKAATSRFDNEVMEDKSPVVLNTMMHGRLSKRLVAENQLSSTSSST
jgi:hypothetical protein